jgi:hypothetical protein
MCRSSVTPAPSLALVTWITCANGQRALGERGGGERAGWDANEM